MLPLEHPDRIHIAFDDHRLVANAGLMLPATLALRLGLGEVVDRYLDLGLPRPGQQRRQADDPGGLGPSRRRLHRRCRRVAQWRHRQRPGLCGQGAVHFGHLPAQLPLGPRSPAGPGSRELLARAWAAGAGPGDGPLTIDLDSTICETYGLAKEGARHHGYTGQRGYHPLLAVAAGTGEVLMARLREGRANTARGAAHFLRETISRVLRRSQGTAHGAGRQRLLHPRYRRRLPEDEGPLLHHHSPAPEPAQPDRGHTRVGLEAHTLLDGRRSRCGREGLYPIQD